MKYITSKGKIYKQTFDDWIESYEECNPFEEVENIPFKWKGGRISTELFTQINSFFQWTYNKWQAESQIRLFYNTKTFKWAAIPFPQEITKGSMTTKDQHSDEHRAKFPEPWQYLGTAHHHCSTGAFQSGTDEENERNQDGFHYTIGKMNEKILDYHGRFSWNGTLFSLNPFQLIECPEFALGAPKALQYEFGMKALLLQPADDLFPDEWKESVIEKKYKTGYTLPYNRHTNAYSEYNHTAQSNTQKQTVFDIIDVIEEFWPKVEAHLALNKPDHQRNVEESLLVQEITVEIETINETKESTETIIKYYKKFLQQEYDAQCKELEDYMSENNTTLEKITEGMNLNLMGVEPKKSSILAALEQWNIQIDELFTLTS